MQDRGGRKAVIATRRRMLHTRRNDDERRRRTGGIATPVISGPAVMRAARAIFALRNRRRRLMRCMLAGSRAETLPMRVGLMRLRLLRLAASMPRRHAKGDVRHIGVHRRDRDRGDDNEHTACELAHHAAKIVDLFPARNAGACARGAFFDDGKPPSARTPTVPSAPPLCG
ncbi:MAG: hypothetical protein HY056_08475 [Proteobacteria bacterium]|nr:hypothetical protein [Pseudomonadota bacterium]